MTDGANWVRLAAVKQIGKGDMFAASVGKRKIAIFHLEDDSWHATDNVCTHAFALLTEGFLDGEEVECPLHAGKFNVRNGKGLCAPIDGDLATYPVRIDGVDVMVAIPA